MLNLCMFTLFMAEKYALIRLVQLNLVSFGTEGNYKECTELLLAIVLVCNLSCS